MVSHLCFGRLWKGIFRERKTKVVQFRALGGIQKSAAAAAGRCAFSFPLLPGHWSELQVQVVAVEVYQQGDEHHEVNDEPHHKAAFFAFIFYMV